MNLIFALVFHLFIILLSCQSIKNAKVNPDKDINKQSPPTETNNQKIFLDKMSFLKVPKSNKESKNANDVLTLEPKTKNQNFIPFVTMKQPVEEVIYSVDLENTGTKKDNVEINEELLLSNLQKEDETKNEVKLEQVMAQDKNEDTRELIPSLSKDEKEKEEALHDKEEIKQKNEQLELKNDVKSTTACNPELCKAGIQHGPGYKSEINEDDHKPNQISFVLNKYVFG